MSTYVCFVCLNRDSLRNGRSGDRILVVARFSAPVQTGLGAHTTRCTMVISSLSRGKSDRSVGLTTDPHQTPKLKKHYSYTITLSGPSWLLYGELHIYCMFSYFRQRQL